MDGDCIGIAGEECKLISDPGVAVLLASVEHGVEASEGAGSSVARGPPIESLNVTVAVGFSNTYGVGGANDRLATGSGALVVAAVGAAGGRVTSKPGVMVHRAFW